MCSRKLSVGLALFVLLLAMVSQSLAIGVIAKDGSATVKVAPVEPLATPDPRAVKVGGTGNLVKNGYYEDSGKVWISFGHSKAKYGCVPAQINYENQSRSNKGVVISLCIFDYELIRCFGTTFRPEEELNELALKGYEAMQNGLTASAAASITTKGDDLVTHERFFSHFDAETVMQMDRNQLIWELGLINFLGRTAEELQNLTIEDVYNLSEIDKLMLAHLGGYNFDEYGQSIAEGGLINPGYALYEIDLHNLNGMKVLPKGEYYVHYELKGYDPDKNEFSDFQINLPIILEIEEDLPQNYCDEYGLSLAKLIDTYEPASYFGTIR